MLLSNSQMSGAKYLAQLVPVSTRVEHVPTPSILIRYRGSPDVEVDPYHARIRGRQMSVVLKDKYI